ncbi:MAG: class I tRNA ligase family protein, partial [Sedimentisphaerales bacterium]|nr:class I tRNA ligase family protein [Sedimentisphaerales bacterium]
MFNPVNSTCDHIELEHRIGRWWQETQAFEKLRQKNAGKQPWSFLDGPITANNPMGVHHAWGRTLKDCYQRYHAMLGHELRYQNGFDCQGLWVEVEVEKELGYQTKADIQRAGLEDFINRCKKRVEKYSRVQTAQSIRLGYWMDWDDSYYTMSDENNYTIWSFLKKCHQRGLIYKGLDAMPWCPRCETGISEQERREGYKNVEDTAVFVRLPLAGRERQYLLVWTTTPWTLAANVAAAVNPELSYARIVQDGDSYYLAEELLALCKEKGDFQVAETLPGSNLVGWEYVGPFDELPAVQEAFGAANYRHRVIPWPDISSGEGTGIVHIAPGCGKEDFDLSKEHKLPVLMPIREDGVYQEGYGFLTGQVAGGVTEQVFEDLRARGFYYKKQKYAHDYPHCWRCGEP